MNRGGEHPWLSAPLPMIEPEVLADVLSSACDVAVVLDTDGVVIAALGNPNTTPHEVISRWSGQPLGSFLTPECHSKLSAILAAAQSGAALPRAVELNHIDTDIWQYPVRYSAHRIGEGTTILLMGRDLQQVAEAQTQLVQAQIALERGYEDHRDQIARARMLLTNARDGFLFVSTDGIISDVNDVAAALLGAPAETLFGEQLDRVLDSPAETPLARRLADGAHPSSAASLMVKARRSGAALHLTPMDHRGGATGMLLCRLAPAEAASDPVPMAETHDILSFFRHSVDGIVLTDLVGGIEAVNDSFLDMTGRVEPSELRHRNLSELLSRGRIDLEAMLATVERSGRMRLYATRLANVPGPAMSVEISATRLPDPTTPRISFAFRDAQRSTQMRATSGSAVDVDAAGLVGQAPLRDIVTAATDEIERICLQSALEMTRNNRAAAAELLGLSRQSLYVKLRKFDLLESARDS